MTGLDPAPGNPWPNQAATVGNGQHQQESVQMGINRESDITASLQIGPTDQGMVRIYVEGEGIELPLDFEPDEAAEIVEELQAAIEAARALEPSPQGGGKGGRRG